MPAAGVLDGLERSTKCPRVPDPPGQRDLD